MARRIDPRPVTERYQSTPGTTDGVFPTEHWWHVLHGGIDGALGSVLDVGCAEGVMSVLAAQADATGVVGIDIDPERVAVARATLAAAGLDTLHFWAGVESAETLKHGPPWTGDPRPEFDTIILSMIAHWIGRATTERWARSARKWCAVIFRQANEHYQIPENGTWFPSLAEMDETVGGIRTLERLLMTQDNEKRIVAAVYRMDMRIEGAWVHKARPIFERRGFQDLQTARPPWDAYLTPEGYAIRYIDGLDLYGDPPFRPTSGKPVRELDGRDQSKLRVLARHIARAARQVGWYPTDFSPRNVILDDERAYLVDLDEIERHDGRVSERYLPIWRSTLSAAGIDFTGDLRQLG